jgi:hypothetical protein
MPQSIQIFSDLQRDLFIDFNRVGVLKSTQYLKLNSAFSDVEPYICLDPLILNNIYVNSGTNSAGTINVYINNLIAQTFNFNQEIKNIDMGIELAVNDKISIQCIANPQVSNINVTLILEYA